MDDVAGLIAERVVHDVDGVLWDWDDVAGAAAALGAARGGELLRAVSGALWRAVDGALSRRKAVEHATDNSPIVSACVGARKEHLLALARTAKLRGARASCRVAELRQLLEGCDAPVGRACPVPVRTACGVVRLRWRWVCASAAMSAYGLTHAQLKRAGCRCAGAQYDGTRLLLRDVRAAARAALAKGELRPGAVLRTRVVLRELATERAVREAREEDQEGRRRALEREVAAAGLPEAMLRCAEAREFVAAGPDAGLQPLLGRMRASAAAAAGEALAWTDEMGHDRDIEQGTRRVLRRTRLCRALATRGLMLRHDSTVCRQYLEGLRDDVDAVVDVMDEMGFFYQHTWYRRVLERRRPRWSWHDPYDEDDEDEHHGPAFDPVTSSRAAKVEALRMLGAVPVDAPANVRRLAADIGVPLVDGS